MNRSGMAKRVRHHGRIPLRHGTVHDLIWLLPSFPSSGPLTCLPFQVVYKKIYRLFVCYVFMAEVLGRVECKIKRKRKDRLRLPVGFTIDINTV